MPALAPVDRPVGGGTGEGEDDEGCPVAVPVIVTGAPETVVVTGVPVLTVVLPPGVVAFVAFQVTGCAAAFVVTNQRSLLDA